VIAPGFAVGALETDDADRGDANAVEDAPEATNTALTPTVTRVIRPRRRLGGDALVR
jgi:hypothetical protein